MLRELHISGLGVIEDLDLELDPGLNVLTGETGAGKTMVTAGLLLALGARASSQVVRSGAKAARVQARFDAPASAGDWAEDGELILARSVTADGKSGARICGQIATASALQDLGAGLVEIHGQHQTLRLTDPGTQTAFLDRFAGDEHLTALAAYVEASERLAVARRELAELTGAARDRERELDLLAYQVREIQAVDPKPGETQELQAEEARLAHVERILEAAGGAEESLSSEGGAADALAGAAGLLEAAAGVDSSAAELAGRASALASEVVELARDVRAYRESLVVDPERLEHVRERMAALRGLQRRYGDTDQDVLAFLAEASARLETLETSDQRVHELTAEVERLGSEAAEAAEVVTAGRRAAAPELSRALNAELEELGMPGASVSVELEGPGAGRAETARLMFSAGPGQPPAPLSKVASGGELSRLMLACRSVMADLDEVPTLVFDEVDAGIGGHAGLAVGRRLARLARNRQVLVVSHLPQIACFADRQIRVEKTAGVASVQVLSEKERVQELARMLAGLEGSEHALSHAEELLAQAEAVKGRLGRSSRPGGEVAASAATSPP